MKKKLIATAALFCFMITPPALAQDITLQLNGNILHPAVAPVIENGSTLVPLRIISENLGAKVQYNAADRSVDITNNGTNIHLILDNKKVTVNGTPQELPVAPKVISGSTMVPIRFVSQNLNCAVDWNSSSRTVSIVQSGMSATPAVTPTSAPATTSKPAASTTATKPVYTANGLHQVISNEDFVVYVTKTGTKYHVDGCSALSRSKIPTTLGKATDQYYDACEKCKAPILDI